MEDITQLTEALRAFTRERDWEQFHTPKNLTMALAGETGELLGIFQWLTLEESEEIMNNESTARLVRSEIADVFIYLTRLADVLQIDLFEAAHHKINENRQRYDACTYRGVAHKAPPLT
ncbi:nucleotide pyrophosphohydrolase [Actinomadura sp. WMMB 499]|uniref:nucleotide pyrophosphohydrolase n=1 Tax=Actinomadura sp. WMMB 499 TaxID=1219491 RepID=UPI001246C4A9|nr:nucleotide pyrophosphohydrolase [Actinomadura sp. WMMB 499]QFG26513.1 nucleotide pyrophosphohydrolase [Actinomadura sp. WMMB 499]